MRNRVAVLVAMVFALLFSPDAFGQCVNGVCQMRTPVRSTVKAIVNAAPIRSTIQAARPANWKVFSGGSVSCSGSTVAPSVSCSGSQIAPTACYCVEQSFIGSAPIVSVAPVVSVAPIVSEVVETSVASVSSSDAGALGVVSDRIAFRRSLKAATRNQVAAGNITPGQAMLLNGLAFFPAKCDAVMAAVHDAAIEEGLATTAAIDWDGLASFIERILPIILQLIQLFG